MVLVKVKVVHEAGAVVVVETQSVDKLLEVLRDEAGFGRGSLLKEGDVRLAADASLPQPSPSDGMVTLKFKPAAGVASSSGQAGLGGGAVAGEKRVQVLMPEPRIRSEEDGFAMTPINITFTSDQDLQSWLANNGFAGLLPLPDVSGTPVSSDLVRRVSELVDGKCYLALPSQGGIGTLRANMISLNNYVDNQASKSEMELENALVVHAPQLLGTPCAAVARQDLHNVKYVDPSDGVKSCEFDAVVDVNFDQPYQQTSLLASSGKAFILGECKASMRSKGDVDNLAKNVKAVANVGEFAGNRLYSAYAVDYAAKDVMEKVVEACRNHGVFCMKRGTGGFIPAAVAKASSRAAPPLCKPLHRLQTPTMFRRAQLPSWRC